MSGFAAITSVGGLLPSDLLGRVTSGDKDLEGTAPENYGFVPGERLNDQVTRSWNRLTALWASFNEQLDSLPESERTATTLTRERWLRPLFDELGFAGITQAKALSIDGKEYAVSHQWGSSVPVHLLGARIPIDRRSPGIPGAATTSPHGLVQEFLNRSDAHLWALLTNGFTLRLLRDNASLTRQAYVEFDLQAMFDGELYSDFVALWLSCHRTRFEGDPPEKCLLEQWSQEAALAGTRALDRLRDGVEEAIVSLGEGFLAHPANTELRQQLQDGILTTTDYQRQLLRIVYRLLFLLVAEARDLLLAPDADEVTRARYRDFYSLSRLTELARFRRGSAHDDLWAGLDVTMTALWHDGEPALGITPLGSSLWSPDSVAALAGARLDNRHLLDTIRSLSLVRDTEAKVDRAIDYRNLGAEELGSVYESLLELHAEVDVAARTFSLGTAAGNERKTTGSYYTPTSLITELLDSALDPVLEEASHADDPESALLSLSVLDPACGSGHFLIAAANRIAQRLAGMRAGGIEPAPEEVRTALRDVIGRCVHGVDVNPMAVELCKVSLWLEATEPGKPLSFLDHRIVCGNALLGTTPRLLADGIPDDAYKALEGDDTTIVGALKKRNKNERKGQGSLDLFGDDVASAAHAIADAVAAIDALPDATAVEIAHKERLLGELAQSAAATKARLAADAWCAAFVSPKAAGEPPITTATVRKLLADPTKADADVIERIDELAQQYRFLHLHLAFPDVISVPDDPDTADNRRTGWNGGFSVVLGNPPWDTIEFRAAEFFAVSRPEIAGASTKAIRDRMIESLASEDEALYAACKKEQRRISAISRQLKASGLLPHSTSGTVNTYSTFTELADLTRATAGRAGLVVQSGVVTDASSSNLFAFLAGNESVRRFLDFKNRLGIFPAVDSRQSFGLLTLGKSSEEAEYFFGAETIAELQDDERIIRLSGAEILRINPTTGVFPPFRNGRDASLVAAAHQRFRIVHSKKEPSIAGWHVETVGFPHAGDDSDKYDPVSDALFEPQPGRTPVYESKMIHHFDHRFADILDAEGHTAELTHAEHLDPGRLARPRNTFPSEDIERLIDGRVRTPWLLGWRDTARNDDARTIISALIPRSAPPRNNLPVLAVEASRAETLAVVATLSSFVLDFIARQKVAGAHVTRSHIEQLPVPSPDDLQQELGCGLFLDLIEPRVLELTYTAWDLVGLCSGGGPFRWDSARRELLRAELDAAFFHLYGICRDDVDYIMDTFLIVKKKDEAEHGEFRTKRLILEIYDRMADAIASGEPYETVLDPPPADPSLCHDPSTRPDWADLSLPDATATS